MEVAITSVLEEHLSRIQRAFGEHGFVQTGDLADRHGALQLTFAKEAKRLVRLVLLNEAVGTGDDNYRGTIDVVVQSGDRFVRRRVIASNSSSVFERVITGDGIEAAAALAESLKKEDLSDSFVLRKDSKTTAATRLAAMAPDELSDVFKRLLAYTEYLRRSGPTAYHSAYTSEDLVTEAVILALTGKRVYDEGLPLFRILAGIVQSLISHKADRPERRQLVLIDEVDDESHSLHDVPSDKHVAAKVTAKDRSQQFARILDTQWRAPREEVRKMLREYGIDPDQAVHRLKSKIASIR